MIVSDQAIIVSDQAKTVSKAIVSRIALLTNIGNNSQYETNRIEFIYVWNRIDACSFCFKAGTRKQSGGFVEAKMYICWLEYREYVFDLYIFGKAFVALAYQIHLIPLNSLVIRSNKIHLNKINVLFRLFDWVIKAICECFVCRIYCRSKLKAHYP